jgi:Organic solvent tolerance protein OstA
MKNKLKIFILSFLVQIICLINLSADEFTFESSSIEIDDQNNIIFAKDGVNVSSNDGLKILSNEATYYKKEKLLILTGNVIIEDETDNIIIQSEDINYDKNLEIIFSKNQTKINIENNFEIVGSDIHYFRLDKLSNLTIKWN